MAKPAITLSDSWASAAAAIDKARPAQAKIDAGWVFGEKPPFQEFNWSVGLLTAYLAYLNEQGMPEWDILTAYKISSFVKVGGVIYTALTDNTGLAPATNPADWTTYSPIASLNVLTADSATPSVLGGLSFKTANTTATTFTGFTDGVAGQNIAVLVNEVYTTIGSAISATGVDRKVNSGDLLIFIYDGASWHEKGNLIDQGILTPDSATPTVGSGSAFETANTVATTITGFVGARKGQKIIIDVQDTNTTIDRTLTKTGMTIPLIVGDMLEFYYNGTDWKQIAGTVGMGQFVKLPTITSLTNWIDTTDTFNVAIDVTVDGIRKGASAIDILFHFGASSGIPLLHAGRTGFSFDDMYLYTNSVYANGQGKIGLDNNGEFEARFATSWVAITNSNRARPLGYYI